MYEGKSMIFFCVKGDEDSPECWFRTLDAAMGANPGKDQFRQVYATVIPGQEYQRVQ